MPMSGAQSVLRTSQGAALVSFNMKRVSFLIYSNLIMGIYVKGPYDLQLTD